MEAPCSLFEISCVQGLDACGQEDVQVSIQKVSPSQPCYANCMQARSQADPLIYMPPMYAWRAHTDWRMGALLQLHHLLPSLASCYVQCRSFPSVWQDLCVEPTSRNTILV